MPPAKRAAPAKSSAKPRYHHGDLKQALVTAGLALANEEGLEALTTRALARKLGVSHAAPARHFPNRSSLLAEVAAAAFERFSQVLSAATDGVAPTLAFAAMGRAYVRFALEHPGLIHLMFSPEIAGMKQAPERLSLASSAAYAVLQNGARNALGKRATDQNVAKAAFLGWAVTHGAATLWLDGPMRLDTSTTDARARFLALSDAAIDGVSAAIAAM
jgi:AcrR family transcriptional regulator